MDFLTPKELAQKKAATADHILTQTYPLVKDPKILLTVVQHVLDSVQAGIEALLRYEYSLKRLTHVPEDYEGRLSVFRHQVAQQHRIPHEFLTFVSELQEIMREHKRSPMEFARKEKFVICDDSYRLRTLNEAQLKKYVARAKAFAGLVAEKVARNDAIITRRS